MVASPYRGVGMAASRLAAVRFGFSRARASRPCRSARAPLLAGLGATVDLPGSGGDGLKEEQALVRVVVDDLGDEAETVALADGVPILAPVRFRSKTLTSSN